MSYPNFTAEDFAKWNQTSSCFRLVGKDAIKDVRVDLIKAIGAERVSAVQALPDHQYRIQFTSTSYKMGYDLNGLNFRGVNITPTPAYEQLTNVFVDRAPLHMPNEYISSSLSAYGRVVSIRDLCVKGYKDIRTGTRMVITSLIRPIPVVVKIANFPCSVRYKGQPPYCLSCNTFGHFACRCQQGKTKKTQPNAEMPVQRSQPMEATSPRTSSSPAASSVRVDAAPPASGEQNVDTAIVAVPPTGMELDSGAGAADNLPSEDDTSSPQPKQLVVMISEFKESLAISHDFSCQRKVSVVQRRSTNRDMTKRLQKPRSTAGAKKSFCLSVPAKGPPPAPSSSPHHATVEHDVSDSVVPDTPPLCRRSGKITRTKHIRERRLLKSSRHLLISKSPSSSTVAVAQSHIVETSMVSMDASAQSAVETSNRFSLLADEVDDLTSLARTVVDPLASPLYVASAVEPVGPTSPSVDHVASGTQPPVPSGEPMAAACLSSAAASQSESSLKLRLSLSEQPAVHAEPFTSPALPSASASAPVVHTPVCTTPPVLSMPAAENAGSSATEFSPPPVPCQQASVPALNSGSAASPAADPNYSFALDVSSCCSSLLQVRQEFPDSPDLFSPRSADEAGQFMMPAFPDSPLFFENLFLSAEENPLSFLPSASRQVVDVADQSVVSPFNPHNNNV